MNAPEIHAEIARLGEQAARWEREKVSRFADLQEALIDDPARYSDHAVRDARSALAVVEQKLDFIAARVDALRGQLPPAAEIGSAEAAAEDLQAQVQRSAIAAEELWRAYLTTLEAAEKHARELMTARKSAATAIAQMRDLVVRYGITPGVPDPLLPDAMDTKLAVHLVALLQDAIEGTEPRDVVEAYLRNARTEREQAAASSAGGAAVLT